MSTQWIYYEVRYREGDLSHAYRWDGAARAEYLNSKGWHFAPNFFDRLYSGDNKLIQLEGTPDWAYDRDGNLIP